MISHKIEWFAFPSRRRWEGGDYAVFVAHPVLNDPAFHATVFAGPAPDDGIGEFKTLAEAKAACQKHQDEAALDRLHPEARQVLLDWQRKVQAPEKKERSDGT